MIVAKRAKVLAETFQKQGFAISSKTELLSNSDLARKVVAAPLVSKSHRQQTPHSPEVCLCQAPSPHGCRSLRASNCQGQAGSRHSTKCAPAP